MKTFLSLSLGIATTAFVFACSSSSSPSGSGPEDGGSSSGASSSGAASSGSSSGTTSSSGSSSGAASSGSSSGTGSSGSSGGSSGCTPGALPDAGVPTHTAPTLAQNVCTGTDISGFVTACDTAAGSSACGTWLNTNQTTTCGKCLTSSTTTIAPLELLVFGTTEGLLTSEGACVLASAGSAAASCASALDDADYCVNEVCSSCSAATGQGCVNTASATGGVCASLSSAAQTACGSYAAQVTACHTAGASAALTATAEGICGSGSSSDGGTDQ